MNKNIEAFLTKYKIKSLEDLKQAIVKHDKELPVALVYEAAELLNPNRDITAAFYTDMMICDYIFKELPDFDGKDSLQVLEPSVGCGNFIPYIAEKYKDKKILEITIIDIDYDELKIAELIFETYFREKYPNVYIRYICDDYLLCIVSGRKYDLVIGNPPYSKLKDKQVLAKYKKQSIIQKSSNLFVLFLEKAIKDANFVSLIVPKSILNAPEYAELRNIIKTKKICSIIDFGENGFKGVKIETVNLIIDTSGKPGTTKIESTTQKIKLKQAQKYITDEAYPSWLIYRNADFDKFARTLHLGMFKAVRDRQIVSSLLSSSGKYRVLKSRNIGSNKIINIPGYDRYINDIEALNIKYFLNQKNTVLIPNLSYAPRACFLPANTIADGSVAFLSTEQPLTERDLEVFSTQEFCDYYRIARNYGTRSLNIDKNSVYFFGIRRKK